MMLTLDDLGLIACGIVYAWMSWRAWSGRA